MNLKNLTIFPQVLGLSETFGRADQPATLDPIDGYLAWRAERSGSEKGGGGLILLYKETLTAHQWNPAVPDDLEYIKNERQWLLLSNNAGDKCAFLHCYIACQNFTSDSYIQWNEGLFQVLTQEAISLRRQGFMILAMGDFNSRVGRIPGLEGNTPDINRNQPMFLNFISAVNLFILNTLPQAKGLFTRFMSSSGLSGTNSLLDYGLVDNDHVNCVTSFIIDEQARVECGSDHALLECEIVLGPSPHIKWDVQNVLQYDFNENTDFTKYKETLDQTLSSISLTQFTNMSAETMLPHLSVSINSSAKKTLGLKVKKKKKGTRLPQKLISLIQAKNETARSLHDALTHNNPQETARLQQLLETSKIQLKDHISDIKLQKRSRLRSKLLRADPTRKRFWRFLKSQIKSAGTITALYKASYKLLKPINY